MNLIQELNELFRKDIQPEKGVNFSTFRIGGELSCLLEVESTLLLKKILSVINSFKAKYRILGRGSNILFPDEGISEPIIKLGKKFNSIVKISNDEYAIGGATSLIELSAKTSRLGLAGLEFAGGIPASLGGAVIMNAGAYGSQLADIISWVDVIFQDGHEERIYENQLDFSYRHCNIPVGGIVVSVGIKLVESDPINTETLRLNLLEQRRDKQPLEYPSAGSIFKNPDFDRSAGWLLDQVGMKGVTIGGAMFAQKHANWIVNIEGKAKAKDVKELIDLAQKKVLSAYNIKLEPELKIW